MIDGYCHCGISKYRPVEDVLAVMQNVGIDRAVLCQHLGEYDNSYLASVVAKHPGKFAAICLVDPADTNARSTLESISQTGHFRGVRLLAQWLIDYESLWARAVELDMTLVLFAPDGIAPVADRATRFVRSHPAARVVVTHLGNPKIQDAKATGTELLKLAACKQVIVQLSGLSQFCEFPHRELDGLIQAVIQEYGSERVYWGSNYPVCGGETEYQRDLQHVLEGAWGLNCEQIQAITHGTAQRLWFSA